MCGWKDRCRDGNLRTYCHVNPILFGWFFVEASRTCFSIFVKCFFGKFFPIDQAGNIPPYCLPVIACCVGGARAHTYVQILLASKSEALVF